MPLEPYPARSARHLPHAGKALSVDIVFSTYAYIRSDDMGIAVLSYNGAHETIFPLFFIPLSLSNLRPFGAPPSIGRREYPREPLPLEGAAKRSEAGLASFLGGQAASSLPSPLGKGDRAAVDRVFSLMAYLRRSFPLVFHTAFPIQPPPLRGTSFQRKEGVSTRAPSLGRGCRAQRGGVGFLFCGEAASSLPSPLW